MLFLYICMYTLYFNFFYFPPLPLKWRTKLFMLTVRSLKRKREGYSLTFRLFGKCEK